MRREVLLGVMVIISQAITEEISDAAPALVGSSEAPASPGSSGATAPDGSFLFMMVIPLLFLVMTVVFGLVLMLLLRSLRSRASNRTQQRSQSADVDAWVESGRRLNEEEEML